MPSPGMIRSTEIPINTVYLGEVEAQRRGLMGREKRREVVTERTLDLSGSFISSGGSKRPFRALNRMILLH